MAKLAIYDREKYRGNAVLKNPHRQWFDDQIYKGLKVAEIYRLQLSEISDTKWHVSVTTLRGYINNILQPNKQILKAARKTQEKIETSIIQEEVASENKQVIVVNAEKVIDADKTFIELHDDLLKVKEKLMVRMNDDAMSNNAFMQGVVAIGELVDKLRVLTTEYLKIKGKYQDAPTTQINVVQIKEHNRELGLLKNLIISMMKEIEPSKIPLFIRLYSEGKERIKRNLAEEEKYLGGDTGLSERQAADLVKGITSSANKVSNKLESESNITDEIPDFELI